MNIWKILSVLFAIIALSAIKETYRISTSLDADIAENRAAILPMALILTVGFLWLTYFFWKKGAKRSF